MGSSRSPTGSLDERRFRLTLAATGFLAGLVVLLTAHELFPYHSANHDEGVYLQQAAMLLDGRLWLTSPVADQLQPWFFVHDGTRLYPKYSPVPAAMFAPGVALGWPRLVLGFVAGATVALVGLLTREAFDRPTGVLAAGIALATPFFLLVSAVFLPYAPTTLLNLTFAYAYVRSVRTDRLRWAVLAGGAIALAFFSRPYTALLFALPFVVHALWTLNRLRREQGISGLLAPTARRLFVVAVLGTAGVGITLAYNAVVTGDPLVFPFLAFAPDDGIGFGERAIGAYSRDYTPALAARTTARLLWEVATRWTVAAPFGTLLALVGLVPVVRSRRGRESDTSAPDRATSSLRLLFVGVAVSVVVGNAYFWGTLNTLGSLSDPTDGFLAQFGPFYHFDLVLPLAALGAAGTLWLVRVGRRTLTSRLDSHQVRVVSLVALLVVVPVVGGAQALALSGPIQENVAYTDYYAQVAEPMADEPLDDALVFVPTPYGPWLNHPFQFLRNGGSFDGPVVYAQDRDAESDLEVLDAFGEREPYRLTYRGAWTGDPTERVTPHLQPLSIRDGPQRFTTTVGVVGTVSTVRLSAGDEARTVRLDAGRTGPVGSRGDPYRLVWAVNESHARLVSAGDERIERAVPLDGRETVSLAVTFVDVEGNPVTYRQELVVDASNGSLRVVWPAEREVCLLTPECGNEGQYVPGGEYIDGVSMNTTVTARATAGQSSQRANRLSPVRPVVV